MPIYEYECKSGCNATFDDFVQHWSQRAAALDCPRCGTLSLRKEAYLFSHQGGDDLKLEAQAKALLTTDERRAGLRFRSQKDVECWEESKGFVRQDPNSSSYRAIEDDQRDEHLTRMRVLKEDGVDGLVRHSTKTDIQANLGWSDAKFNEWEDRQNEAPAPDDAILNSSIAECGATAGNDNGGA